MIRGLPKEPVRAHAVMLAMRSGSLYWMVVLFGIVQKEKLCRAVCLGGNHIRTISVDTIDTRP